MLKNIENFKSPQSTQTLYNLRLHKYLSFIFVSFGFDEKFVKIGAKR